MTLDIYLNYRGNCEQAFRFYEQQLGGRITGMVARRAAQSECTGRVEGQVLHARIEIGTTVLMGADIRRPNHAQRLSEALAGQREEAERIYALLADGGEIFMKMEADTLRQSVCHLRDKFGTSWMLLHQHQTV